MLGRFVPCLQWFSSGKVEEDEVVDSNVLEYCSIDKKQKKSLGELEQEFLQALQVKYIKNFYFLFLGKEYI